MISTNSPGHYANSLVTRGVFDSFEEAVDQVRDIAKVKLPDLRVNSIEAAMRVVEGTARAMGIKVEG